MRSIQDIEDQIDIAAGIEATIPAGYEMRADAIIIRSVLEWVIEWREEPPLEDD